MQTEKPDPGVEYTYDQVGDFYTHDPLPLHWVIVRGNQIVALRLREDYNKNIFNERAEVWVGDDSPTKEWGKTLADDTPSVPVFVKRNGSDKYTYVEQFEIQTDEATAQELESARESVEHDRGISRIVFLRKK
jgi:hypothetical protein